MYRVSIRHNFETAHRLSEKNAPEKCLSIHGHSWWATVFIEGKKVNEEGMLIEFGQFKKVWRQFLDDHMDHHLMVVQGDPVVAAIRSVLPESRILELPFSPTTENVARWLCEKSETILKTMEGSENLHISKVHIQETSVNSAEYEPEHANTRRR